MSKNAVIVLLAVIVIGLGAWFYFSSPASAPTVSNPTATSPQTGNTDQNTVQNQNGVVAGVTVGVGAVKSFTVTGSNFKFVPNQISVKKGDTVQITFKSSGGSHNFTIDEFSAGTKTISSSNAAETIQFVADKAGTFEYYCSVGNHRAMGMVGKLVVTE